MVKNLPAMWETWVQSMGWEDTLEKGMELYSWWGRKQLDMTEWLSLTLVWPPGKPYFSSENLRSLDSLLGLRNDLGWILSLPPSLRFSIWETVMGVTYLRMHVDDSWTGHAPSIRVFGLHDAGLTYIKIWELIANVKKLGYLTVIKEGRRQIW